MSSDTAQSRLSTRLAFWVAGFAVSCWAPLVPFAKERLAVDDRTLGLLLLCLGIGSVAAMLRTGPLCARYGCKPVIISGGVGLIALLPALAVVDTPLLLALVLFGFGGALGSLDVAMNVQAVEVERDAKRPLMSGFHALFSVGGFAGAALMTFLLSLSLSPLAGTLICSALMLAAMLVTAPRLLVMANAPGGELFALPRGPVLLIAALAAVTFLVEGALLDWSALLLTGTGLVGTAQAGIGYAVFSVAMTVGRFGGDAITARFGDRAVMFWGAVVAIAGFAVLLLAPHMSVAMTGFLLIGFGASNVVPVLFRRAGSQRAMPAALAISAITTTGYAGHLMGPAAVGLVSKSAGLPAAFWVLAGLMCLVPVFARTVAGESASEGARAEAH
jgi:predicted MFS family arabinose efflux permease